MRYPVSALIAAFVMSAAGWLSGEEPLPVAQQVANDAALVAALPWQPATPRSEICPAFSFDPQGGPAA